MTECLLPCLAVFGVQAQAVTLTVAQAFKVALDLWEVAQEGEFIEWRWQQADWLKASFPFCPWKVAIVDMLAGFLSSRYVVKAAFYRNQFTRLALAAPNSLVLCSPWTTLPTDAWKGSYFPPGVRLRALFFFCLADKSKKARTCCSCAASAGQKEMADTQCAAGSTFLFSPFFSSGKQNIMFEI